MMGNNRHQRRRVDPLGYVDELGVKPPWRPPQQAQPPGQCSTTAAGSLIITRLWSSCHGLACSRCSLPSVDGRFEKVREAFSGRYRRSTSSINSSLLIRSGSWLLIP